MLRSLVQSKKHMLLDILQQSSECSKAFLRCLGPPQLKFHVGSVRQSLLPLTEGSSHSTHHGNLDRVNHYSQGQTLIGESQKLATSFQNNSTRTFEKISSKSTGLKHILRKASLSRVLMSYKLVICLYCTACYIVVNCAPTLLSKSNRKMQC